MELTEQELAEIARLIKEGFSSGFVDCQEENGKSYRITWELKATKWER